MYFVEYTWTVVGLLFDPKDARIAQKKTLNDLDWIWKLVHTPDDLFVHNFYIYIKLLKVTRKPKNVFFLGPSITSMPFNYKYCLMYL